MASDSIFFGTSGAKAGLWKLVSGKPELIQSVQDGFSPYALDLSNDNNYLAVGFSNSSSGHRSGKVIILKLSENGEKATLVIQKRLPASVLSVCFLNDALLACGTMNGTIRLWKLNQLNEDPIEINAHKGFVINLTVSSKGTFYTIGSDCILKEWDMNGQFIQEFQHSNTSVRSPNFQAICDLGEQDIILAQYPNGLLCSINKTGSGNEIETLHPSHSTAFLANVYVVLDPSRTTLRLFDITNHQLLQDAECTSAVGLTPVSATEFVVIKKNKQAVTAEIWEINPLRKKEDVPATDLRGFSTFKRPLFIQFSNRQLEQRRKELLSQSTAYMASPDESDIKNYCDQLGQAGLEFESYIIFAEWCKRYNHPLYELQARLNLNGFLTSESPEEAVYFVSLAQLYETLNEPELALDTWYIVQSLDKHINGLTEKTELLESIVEIRNNHNTIVLDYFGTPQAIYEEKDKYVILNQPWRFPFAIRIKSEVLEKIKSREDIKALQASLLSEKYFQKKEVCFFTSGISYETQTVLEYIHGNNNQPYKILVSLKDSGEFPEAVYRFVLIPNPDFDDAQNWQSLENTLSKFTTDNFQKWLESIPKRVERHCKLISLKKDKSTPKVKKF